MRLEPDVDVLIGTDFEDSVRTDALVAVCAYSNNLLRLHVLVDFVVDLLVELLLDMQMGVAGGLHVVVVADLLMLLGADEGMVIVLDVQVVVALGVHEDLFFAVEVFKAELVGVGGSSALGAARENA